MKLVTCSVDGEHVILKFDTSVSIQDAEDIARIVKKYFDGEAHCKTCQCNRTDALMPLGNPRKKSWHHG